MEGVGLFYGILVYLVALWSINGYLVDFIPCWYVVPRKIWQPCFRLAQSRSHVILIQPSFLSEILSLEPNGIFPNSLDVLKLSAHVSALWISILA
jgi:hypothetical protein